MACMPVITGRANSQSDYKIRTYPAFNFISLQLSIVPVASSNQFYSVPDISQQVNVQVLSSFFYILTMFMTSESYGLYNRSCSSLESISSLNGVLGSKSSKVSIFLAVTTKVRLDPQSRRISSFRSKKFNRIQPMRLTIQMLFSLRHQAGAISIRSIWRSSSLTRGIDLGITLAPR